MERFCEYKNTKNVYGESISCRQATDIGVVWCFPHLMLSTYYILQWNTSG